MAIKQDRAARTRRDLIHSAAQVFDRQGYVQARLADISAGAGVSAGALHFHFENKAAVADAVEAAAGDALLAATRAVCKQSPNPIQALVDVSHVLVLLLCEDVVVRAGFHLNGDHARRNALDFCRQWRGCVTALLAKADTANLLAADVVKSSSVCTIVAATTGIAVLTRDGRGALADRALTGLWGALLSALGAPHMLDRLEPAGTRTVVDGVLAGNAVARYADAKGAGERDGHRERPATTLVGISGA